MRKSIIFTGLLELYAIALAVLQQMIGLRTDEAKYLLNIPYPHPPFARFIMHGMWEGNELLWRILLATLLVQSVWLLWELGSVLPQKSRVAVAASWLFSSALVIQAGTVMLAPLTAFFGLVFVFLALKPRSGHSTDFGIALFWLAGLFSAYQVVLYLPLVVSVLWRRSHRPLRVLLFVGMPLILLCLYSLTNPLALASMFKVTTQDAVIPFTQRLLNAGWIWIIAGSGIVSLIGTWGLLMSGRRDLAITFILIAAYIVLSAQEYYAILLTPLLAAGVFSLACRRRLFASPLSVSIALIALAVFVQWIPVSQPVQQSRSVMSLLTERGESGLIIIDGYFGHDWQYESSVPVHRFSQALSHDVEEQAQAIVCTRNTCEENIDRDHWKKLDGAVTEVWVRR